MFHATLLRQYKETDVYGANFEVFTLPHVFHVESEQSPRTPRTKFGLNSDFF